VLYLEIIEALLFRKDFLKEGPELWDIPLAVAEIVD
jgi:hypothetical protein